VFKEFRASTQFFLTTLSLPIIHRLSHLLLLNFSFIHNNHFLFHLLLFSTTPLLPLNDFLPHLLRLKYSLISSKPLTVLLTASQLLLSSHSTTWFLTYFDSTTLSVHINQFLSHLLRLNYFLTPNQTQTGLSCGTQRRKFFHCMRTIPIFLASTVYEEGGIQRHWIKYFPHRCAP
jgi:hypothetical protein